MVDVGLICKRAKEASYDLAARSAEEKNAMLSAIARALTEADNLAALSAANAEDVAAAKANGKDAPFIDRLTLTEKRVATMIEGLRQIAALPDPVGEVVEERTLPNGLDIKRVRAPLGVIGIIYEARPNVTVDAAALCRLSASNPATPWCCAAAKTPLTPTACSTTSCARRWRTWA